MNCLYGVRFANLRLRNAGTDANNGTYCTTDENINEYVHESGKSESLGERKNVKGEVN